MQEFWNTLCLCIVLSLCGRLCAQTTDVSKCPCDLTGLACDVNCCCDPDCSNDDKRVFTQCLKNSYRFDDRLCFDRDVFFSENGPAFSNTTDGLFCIYFDNEEKRNYYVVPSLVATEAQFVKYVEDYGTFSFQPVPVSTFPAVFSNYYKSGDPLFVVFASQSMSYLALPAALSVSSVCADGNPAAYLIDQSNTCMRRVNSLELDCESTLAFRADTYYQNMRIVRDPFLLQAFNSTTSVNDPVIGSVDLTGVTDLYNNDFTLVFSLQASYCITNGLESLCNLATPTWNAVSGQCENVVTKVHYTFETQGTFGIQTANVSFVFSNIDTVEHSQTFSTSFITTADSANSISRSGNPGYDVGKPVLTGILNQTIVGGTTQQRILQTTGPQLSIVRPSASGDCSTLAGQPREPILFGESMRSGCFVSVPQTSNNNMCQYLQATILQVQEGQIVPEPVDGIYPKNNRYVATFGDSSTEITGDWVEIIYQNRPIPSRVDSSKCLLSLGMSIEILYANVGALANPQAKIIGVSFVYAAQQTVEYLCSGQFCQPGSPSTTTQRIEISTSVNFIEASNLPEGVEGEYPTFAAKLPYDFFYPFLNSSPTFCLDHRITALLAALVVLLNMQFV